MSNNLICNDLKQPDVMLTFLKNITMITEDFSFIFEFSVLHLSTELVEL